MSIVLGITGSFQTGKSTAAAFFQKKGARFINLDAIAHETLKSSHPCFKKVVRVFGEDIVVGRRIDRRRLAAKVFGDKKRLARLNTIIHPVVIRTMVDAIASLKEKYRMIVVEAPLLFEAKIEKFFDYIIVVTASRKAQLVRAQKSFGCSRTEALERIASQMALSQKKQYADFIIHNNGSKKEIEEQVNAIVKKIKNEQSNIL